MLDLFRKKGLSSIVYGVVIAATILVFVIQFRPNAGQKGAALKEACVATVSGWCIDPKDYRATYRILMPKEEGMPSQRKARAIGLSRLALDGLIERELLHNEAERIGLQVSEDEITDQIYNGRIKVSIPMEDLQAASKLQQRGGEVFANFKDEKTKQFDVKVYERAIRNIVGRSPTEFREEQGREILAAKMRDLVMAPVRVSEPEALELYETEKSSATVTSIPVKQSWVSRWGVVVGAADLDAWSKDATNAAEIDKLEKEREAEDLPKANHLRHILVKTPPDPTDDDLTKAAQVLAQARARIAAGATFAEVARSMSDDKGSALRGGELGDKTDGFVPSFRAAAEALKPGETTATAIQSPFGLHLIMKEDAANEAAVKAALPKDIARELYLKSKSLEKAKELAQKLLADVNGGKKPEEAIDAMIASLPKQPALPAPMPITREAKPVVDAGAADATAAAPKKDAKKAAPAKATGPADDPDRPTVVVSSPFNKGGDPIAGLSPEAERQVVDFAFSGKDGDWLKDPLRADDGFLVLSLKEHKTATPEDFEKEKSTYIERLLMAKKAEAISLHVKRLREASKGEIKIDETYLADQRKDGGAEPTDEDEEAP